MKDRIITAYLKDFVEEFSLNSLDETEAFEAFVSHLIMSKHQPEAFEPEDVTVAGDNDMGIDGIGILVNDHLAFANSDVDHFKKAFHRLDVQFVFVQAKTSPHFEGAEIGNFLSGVRQFFEQSLSEANDAIRTLYEVKEHIFDSSRDMDRSPICRMYYITTGTWTGDTKLRNRVNQGVDDLKKTGLFSSVDFIPIDLEGLKRLHRELHRKIIREIIFEKHAILPQITGVRESYIGIVPCLEYLKLICDDDDNLNRRLFYDNVRDFQGHNAVNREIEDTVKDSKQNDRFALLNNGVTVVARDMNKVGATFCLRDYQIVNGCQTSHILYLNRMHLTEQVYLPLKLIVTEDADMTNQIIQGTNRQTEVKIEAFESLVPFQKKLEEFYLAVGRGRKEQVYYERRSKQYEHLNLRRDRVISLPKQIKAFVAMFLNEPHSTHRYYGELLSSYRNRLFSESHSPMPYFISGLALGNMEHMFAEDKLPRLWKNYRYQLLMVFRIQNQPFALPYMNSKRIDKYCEALLGVLDSDSSSEEAFKRAGSLIESTHATIRTYQPAHRTRVFTNALIETASGQKAVRAATATRMHGTVKWYSDIQCYGFIAGDNGTDYFVHYTGIAGRGYRSLVAEQRVEFTTVQTARGPQAIDVEVDVADRATMVGD
jgi:cold shock CspA family protein